MRLLTSWGARPKRPSREEALPRIKQAVVDAHPVFIDVRDEVARGRSIRDRTWWILYRADLCPLDGVPRFLHCRPRVAARKGLPSHDHLIPYGGEH
jgi:hypothetical protein